MMAAWNVVSVYSNVGTDFPELHKSIVELKSVLQDFEEGSGKAVVRGAPEFRSDFAGEEKEKDEEQEKEKEVRGEKDMPDASQDGDGAAGNGGEEEDAPAQQQDDYDSLFNDPEAEPEPEPESEQDLPAIEMPPPRTPHCQKKKKHLDEEVPRDPRRNNS